MSNLILFLTFLLGRLEYYHRPVRIAKIGVVSCRINLIFCVIQNERTQLFVTNIRIFWKDSRFNLILTKTHNCKCLIIKVFQCIKKTKKTYKLFYNIL